MPPPLEALGGGQSFFSETSSSAIQKRATSTGIPSPPPCILLAPIQATPQQKVQIVKTADVKIQVRGLLPGQQLVHMPDGKLSADNSLRCCKIPAVAVSKNCIQRENVVNQGRIQGGVAPPP